MNPIQGTAPNVVRHPFYTVARRTAGYLRSCQVVAPDVVVELEARGSSSTGILETRELAGDARRYRYHFRVSVEGRRPSVHIAADADPGTFVGPFFPGDYFRLFEGKFVNQRQHEGLETEGAYTRRLGRKYLALIRRELGVLSIERTARLLEGVRDLGRYYLDRRRRVDTLTPLDDVIGVTWRLEGIAADRLELSCYDRGGVLDFHTNAEVEKLPPQVMGTLYADAYAAWIFAFCHLTEQDPDFLAASNEALSFIARTYASYDVCRTMAHHADFKNAGILETLAIVGDGIPTALREQIESIARSLREDLYLPTNVFALRHHWKTAQATGGYHTMSGRERARIRTRVARDLGAGGIIHDNNPGRFYFDSHDLTYHQYSLACIADSLRLAHDSELERVFLAGVGFSAACMTPDGEVAYMGRGANNIYHMASAIAAFTYAAKALESTDAETSARYVRASRLVFSYLSKAQRADGMLPVALNDQPERRMAWNHCHTPYNALTAYFLARAARDQTGLAESDTPADLPVERSGRFERQERSRFTFVTRSGYYATHFAGAERSYWWSAPNHYTGVPGLAMLGIAGHGALLPILDGLVTDHPCPDDEPCGRAEVTTSVGSAPFLTVRRGACRRTYVFLDGGILITTRGAPAGWALRIPSRDDGDWKSETTWGGGRPTITATDGAAGVSWSLIWHSLGYDEEEMCDRLSNPRGYALLRRVGRVDMAQREAGVAVELVVPFAGEAERLEPVVTSLGARIVIAAPGVRVVDSPERVTVE